LRKLGGRLPLTSYPFPYPLPQSTTQLTPELGGLAKSWGLNPPIPLTLSPACSNSGLLLHTEYHVGHSLGRSVGHFVSHAKMAEPIEMPFWDADSGEPKEPCV